MARIVIGAVGAVVGFIYGGPAGAALGWSIAYGVSGYIIPTKLPTAYGPRLIDLKVQDSQYGGQLPLLWGNARISGNLIWASDIMETRHEDEVDGGGKGGGSSSQTQVTYTYSVHCAVALCQGPISAIRRIWANGELIYDQGVLNQVGAVRLYTGTEVQNPDGLMQSYLGTGNVPAYRGVAYAVLENVQLERYGNRVPYFNFEVVRGAARTSVSNPLYQPYDYTLHDMLPYIAEDNVFEVCCYNPLRNEIALAGYKDDWVNGCVVFVDALTGAVKQTTTFPIDDWLYSASVYASQEQQIWFQDSDSIYKLSATTGAYLGKVTLSTSLYLEGMRYDPATGKLWIPDNSVANRIHEVDKNSGGVLQTIDLPANKAPFHWRFGANSWAWWANGAYGGDKTYGLCCRNVGTGEFHEIPGPSLPGGTTGAFVLEVCYVPERKAVWCSIGVTGSENGYLAEYLLPDDTPQYVSYYDESGSGMTLVPYDITIGTWKVVSLGNVRPYINYFVQISLYLDEANHLLWSFCHDYSTNQHAVVAVNVLSRQVEAVVRYIDGSTPIFWGYNEAVAVNRRLWIPHAGYTELTELYPVTSVTLGDIVGELCDEAGLLPSQYDTSALTDAVYGYAITRTMNARTAIEILQASFFFDAVETSTHEEG